MVDQPVNGCHRRHRILEYLVPFREHQIAAQEYAPPFVAFSQKREQHFHFFPVLLDVAQVVQNDRVKLVQLAQQPFQPQLALGGQ